LTVDLFDDFTPSVGQSYTLLTANEIEGAFTNEQLPSVPGLSFDVIYNPQSVVLAVSSALTADFNDDGRVDAADLAQWQSAYGANVLGDADADGDTDGDDFLAWQRQLGSTLPAISGADAVPEPGSAALWALAAALLVRARRRTSG
jgi:hypothetical protein